MRDGTVLQHLVLLCLVRVLCQVRAWCPEEASFLRSGQYGVRRVGQAIVSAALLRAMHGLVVRRALVEVPPRLRKRDPRATGAVRGAAKRPMDTGAPGGPLRRHRAAPRHRTLLYTLRARVAHIRVEHLLELVRWPRQSDAPIVVPGRRREHSEHRSLR